jgi:hypothetical protein
MQVLTRTGRGRNEGRPKNARIQKIDESKNSSRNFISKFRNSSITKVPLLESE